MNRRTRRVKKDRRNLARHLHAPVTCDLVCPSCEHTWSEQLIPAAHVFLNCPECGARLQIAERPPEGTRATGFTSRS